jgi:ArsR family transcriptional regulator
MDRQTEIARAFRALSDPNRLRILELLKSRGRSICPLVNREERGLCGQDVMAQTGLSQAAVAHHMAVLVTAGLVHAQRRSRWVFYSRNDQVLARIGETIARAI